MQVTASNSYSPEFCLAVVLAEIICRLLEAISSVFTAIVASKKAAQDPTSIKFQVKKMEASLGSSSDAVKQAKDCLRAIEKGSGNSIELEHKCRKALSEGKFEENARKTAAQCKVAIEKAKGCQFLIKRIILSLNSHHRVYRHLLEDLPSEICDAAYSVTLFCRRLPADLTDKKQMQECMSKSEESDPLKIAIQFYQRLSII